MSGFVLIVDDEAPIRELLTAVIEEGGFSVVAAATGKEAIALIGEQSADFSALVTDVKLAGGTLTGWDIGRVARERNPSMPVVYMTGDSGHDWHAMGVPNSILVAKPFAPAQIVTAVAQLLNASQPLGA